MKRTLETAVRRYVAATLGILLLAGIAASAEAGEFKGAFSVTDPKVNAQTDTLNFTSPVGFFDVTLTPGNSVTFAITTYTLDSHQASFALNPASNYGDGLMSEFSFSLPNSVNVFPSDGQLADQVYTDGVKADTENAVTELFIPPTTTTFADGEQLTVTFLATPTGEDSLANGTANSGTLMATFTDANAPSSSVPEPASMAILGVGMVGIAATGRRKHRS